MTSRSPAPQPTAHSARSGPLAGVRVIDMSNTFMAPYATLLMAQMGADVIKVEPPGGDISRDIGDRQKNRLGPVFINANRGKRSVVLDLKAPEDYDALCELLRDADVFVHNQPPAASRRLKVDYDSVKHLNPRLIHCGAFGFDSQGPYADLPAYDDVIQGACGLAYVQTNGGEPAYVRTSMADKSSGLMVLSAINSALFERERSGVGQAIEVSMLETMASYLLLELQQGWVYDPPQGPTGYSRTASPYRRPHATKDGMISVLVYTDAHWRRFFALVGQPELADDERFSSMRARTDHIDALYTILEGHLLTKTTAEWTELLRAERIPVMPVNSLTDLFEDPHLKATGFFAETEQPGVGTIRTARLPIRYSRTTPDLPPPAPWLGEHNDIVGRSRP